MGGQSKIVQHVATSLTLLGPHLQSCWLVQGAGPDQRSLRSLSRALGTANQGTRDIEIQFDVMPSLMTRQVLFPRLLRFRCRRLLHRSWIQMPTPWLCTSHTVGSCTSLRHFFAEIAYSVSCQNWQCQLSAVMAWKMPSSAGLPSGSFPETCHNY